MPEDFELERRCRRRWRGATRASKAQTAQRELAAVVGVRRMCRAEGTDGEIGTADLAVGKPGTLERNRYRRPATSGIRWQLALQGRRIHGVIPRKVETVRGLPIEKKFQGDVLVDVEGARVVHIEKKVRANEALPAVDLSNTTRVTPDHEGSAALEIDVPREDPRDHRIRSPIDQLFTCRSRAVRGNRGGERPSKQPDQEAC
ncbi:MAG: hypothetical protein ACKPE6_05960, partial [Gammaproteobacteria bacterium]